MTYTAVAEYDRNMEALAARLDGTPEYPPLSAWDTCDQERPGKTLSAVRVVKGALTLTLCKHHFEENEIALMLAEWGIAEDIRSQLT